MKGAKHASVAVFVPHAGCKHACSFCDQRSISGAREQPTTAQVRETIERASSHLSERAKPAQIAFFGGSFTAVDKEYMLELLQSVQPYIDGENFSGIRVSTRPDAVNSDILDILKQYQVEDIELGAQSMDNDVLKANRRGHNAVATEAAAEAIKSRGFGLGLQMMTGLHQDSTESTVETARRIAGLEPDCVRVYPTVVLRGTMLAELYRRGEYMPQTLDGAVELGADLLELFTRSGIPVIRLGLHDSPGLAGNILAGPHHPALRELCENRALLRKALVQLERRRINKGKIVLRVNTGSVSKMVGQKRVNLLVLEDAGYRAKIIPDDSIGYLEVEVEEYGA